MEDVVKQSCARLTEFAQSCICSEIAEIDWQRACYASVRQAALAVATHKLAALSESAMRAALNAQARVQDLRNCQHLPLHFVAQEALPAACAYESFIYEHAAVPTRENLHDFFNALVWLSFPRIKQELNRLQAAQIRSHGVGQQRGALRDAATLFDENAALLLVPDQEQGHAWVAALRSHQWPTVFAPEQFGSAVQISLFGHALMEKLVRPYKAITAHAYVVYVPAAEVAEVFHAPLPQRQAWLDCQVAAQLQAANPVPADFCPLPVAGIPQWWTRQDAAFYADVAVFRPARQKKS